MVTVGEIMNPHPISVKPGIPVAEVARLMRAHDVGSILILDDSSRLLGILTEQGIVHKIVARERHPSEVLVEEIMIRDPETVPPWLSLTDAARIMLLKRIRQLPVVHEDRVLGLVTKTDILRAQPALAELFIPDGYQQGVCEQCGRESLLVYAHGRWLCQSCREAEEERGGDD